MGCVCYALLQTPVLFALFNVNHSNFMLSLEQTLFSLCCQNFKYQNNFLRFLKNEEAKKASAVFFGV